MKKVIFSLVVASVIGLSNGVNHANAEFLNEQQIEMEQKSSVSIFVANKDDIDYFIERSIYSYVSAGSGYAFSQKYVLTAAHVVESAYNSPSDRGIYLSDGKGSFYKAEIYFYDRQQDIAILKTNKTSRIIELDTSLPYEGEEVTTISSPISKQKDETTIPILMLNYVEQDTFIEPYSFRGKNIWHGSSGGAILSTTGYRGFIISLDGQDLNRVYMVHSFQIKNVLDQLHIPYIEKKKGE